MNDLFTLPPWWSPIRPGQRLVNRVGTVHALHVINCGEMGPNNEISSPSGKADTLIGSKNFLVVDADGLTKTLMDIRDYVDDARENMNSYYCRVRVSMDDEGDGVDSDDVELYMISDGVAAEAIRLDVQAYGDANKLGDDRYVPCAYESSRDACWRTLAMRHESWAAAETHYTHYHVEIWRRGTDPTNEVIT